MKYITLRVCQVQDGQTECTFARLLLAAFRPTNVRVGVLATIDTGDSPILYACSV